MGNNQSRKTPMEDTPAHDMFVNYGEQSCKFLDKWSKDGLFPKDGSFDMDQVLDLKEGLLKMKSQSRRGEWRAFSCWYGKASERHHKSLTDIQEKQKAQLADMAARFSKSKAAQRKLADQLAKSKDNEMNLADQLAESRDAQEVLEVQLADIGAQFANSSAAQRKLADQLAKSKDNEMNLADQLAESKDNEMNLADQLAESRDAQEVLEVQLAAIWALDTDSRATQLKLEGQLDNSRETQKELEVQLADIRAQFATSSAAQRKLADQLAKSKNNQMNLANQLAESRDARKVLEVQLAAIWAQLTDSRATQLNLEDQLARSKDAYWKLEHQLARSNDAHWTLEDQLAKSKDAQEKLKSEIADLKTKCEACCPWKPKPSAQELPALWQRVLEGENGPATSHATWTPGELQNLRNLFPNIQNCPGEFKEALDFIFRYYNPRWGEVNWFLGIVIPQRTVREQLLARAQWPATVPSSEVALMLAKQCLLGAVLGVCPKNINWSLICQCKQKSDETPPDFWKRLKESFEKYSGIPQPMENAPDVMAYAFLQSLQPEKLEWWKKFGIKWRATSLIDLVNIADFDKYLEKQEQKRWEMGFEDPAYRMFYDSD